MRYTYLNRGAAVSIVELLCLTTCKRAVGEATTGGEITSTLSAADIFAVWKLRQESLEPVRVDIEEERTYLRGSMFLTARAKGSRRVAGKLPTLPESDETYPARARFLFESAAARRDDMTPQWNADDGVVTTLYHVNTRDPLAVWGFEHSPNPAWREWLKGDIGIATTESKGFGVDPGQLAVLLHVRPFSNEVEYFINASDWRLVPSQIANRDDEGCLRLVARRTQFGAKLGKGEYRQEMWVDPARDYSLVRYIARTGEAVSREIKTDLTERPGIGWFPARWETYVFKPHDDGTSELMQYCMGKVTEVVAGPEAIATWKPLVDDVKHFTESGAAPAGPFEMAFRVGVSVSDQRERTRWRFRADGTKEILPDPRTEQENVRAVANDPSAMISLAVLGTLSAGVVINAVLRNQRKSAPSLPA